MKKIVLICTFLSFFCSTMKAQISTNELPYSWERGRGIDVATIPAVTLHYLDLEALYEEDRENERSGVPAPFRFGFSHEVNLSMDNSGVWSITPDGGRLWTLRLYSPDALSLNLLYDKFYMPDDTKFFLYSEDRRQHIGAFTSRNNQGNREKNMGFATGLLFTNSIILEYYEPENVENRGIISISHVISGYRSVHDFFETGGNNMQFTCHNDITCPIGNDYLHERNAVALTVIGGQYWCTGALLNTTANDNSPMFLTADHCLRPNVNQWVFHWHYEAPCGGNAVSPNRTTTGANLLANWADTDFALLRLIEDPVTHPNVTPYYLGWSRATTSATSGAVIHHPAGSPKKISTTDRNIVSQNNYYWRVLLTNGTTEGGSSGAPLLDQNKRVIGQNYGGSSGCPNPTISKTYGRFDVSWTGGGTNATRLRNWLDPNNTVMFLSGISCPTSVNFTGRTVSTSQTVRSCGDINVQNVTVTNGAELTIRARRNINIQNVTVINNSKLILDTAGEVIFAGDFEMSLGSELEIKYP